MEDRLAAADQGGQFADGFAVGLVVLHRVGQHHLGKKGEIGVVRFLIHQGVTVDADKILVVFQGDIAAEVGAEGAGLVVVFGGADEKGRVIDDRAEILHDLVMDLDPHADLDAALRDPDAVAAGDPGHPFGPDPSRRQDDVGVHGRCLAR